MFAAKLYAPWSVTVYEGPTMVQSRAETKKEVQKFGRKLAATLQYREKLEIRRSVLRDLLCTS